MLYIAYVIRIYNIYEKYIKYIFINIYMKKIYICEKLRSYGKGPEKWASGLLASDTGKGTEEVGINVNISRPYLLHFGFCDHDVKIIRTRPHLYDLWF